MIATLGTIWLLHVVVLITPGMNMLLVSQFAAGERTRSAVFAAFGVALGTLMWSGSALLGVHTVFKVLPQARLALQLAGACYLLYVAFRLWRSPGTQSGATLSVVADRAAFRIGFLTNASNPKTALFFGSIFAAAFPAQPGAGLMVLAMVMVVGNALLWHLLLAFLFSRPRIRSLYARQSRLLTRLAAGAAAAMGLGLTRQFLLEARRDL